MPRRASSTNNDQQEEPRRSLRRSNRLQTNDNLEESATVSSKAQATPTGAFAVAPTASLQHDDAPLDNDTKPSAVQLPGHILHTRARKRDSSSDNESSRKKSRSSSTTTARISLDAAAAANQYDADDDSSSQGDASTTHAKYNSSTITPVCSTQKRSRTEETVGPPSSHAANLLGGNNHNESSSASSSAVSVRQEQRKVLPQGVVDLYPTHTTSRVQTCKNSLCATKSLNETFLMSYGREYYQNLKHQEQQHHHDDDVSSHASSTNRTSSTDAESLSLLSSSPRHVVSLENRPIIGVSPEAGDLECLEHQPFLSVKMRAILMDWLVELSEEYKFAPQTLQLAVALVDKCLAACGAPSSLSEEGSASGFFTVKREMLQCVGCACIWIASKMEELDPPVVMDFVYISDSSYTKEQITDMELTVCTALEFRLAVVTPYHFISEYLRASCACGEYSCEAIENPRVKHMVLYLLELMLLPHELAHVSASLKAAAAVYVARVNLGIRSTDGSYWNKTLEYYTGYNLSDLEETAMTIHRYHRAAEESQLKSTFAKFSKEKYTWVALKTVPLESEFGF